MPLIPQKMRKSAYITFAFLLASIIVSACTDSRYDYEEPLIMDLSKEDSTEHDSLYYDSQNKDSLIDNNKEDSISNDTIINIYRDSLTIAHWNIGHFANGKSSDTAITSENYSEKRSQYISVIDSLNADIFGVCEYNPNFDQDGNRTRDAIFYQYNYASIGPKYSYNCNAIFSKDIPLENGGKTYFSRHKQNRYIQSAEIRVNEKVITFIETHLDWNQGQDGSECRKSQIQELIDMTRDLEYVIICADFNISDTSEYNPFKEAGFSLANYDESSESYTNSLIDNIVVKGLKIQNYKIPPHSGLSDHNILKCCISL